MIATHHQQASTGNPSFNLTDNPNALDNVKNLSSPSPLLLPSRIVAHHPRAGLNPLADAASYLFTMLGKLKHMETYRQLNNLQKKLIQEISLFQESIKHPSYNSEYLLVCRYIICATFDDIIANTTWGSQGQWEHYSLLAAFDQDPHHQQKFFTILERALKEPAHYIDLMELMFFCLSLGYKGQYRSTEYNQHQLEQITDNLYKHIRIFRGHFIKTLSPLPLKPAKSTGKTSSQGEPIALKLTYATVCVVMSIFISLGYLMDVISNEAYKNIAYFEKTVSHETHL